MQLTEGQQAVVAHGTGPARIMGTYASGKTAALRARAERLAGEAGTDRLLVLCRSAGTARRFGLEATTFWGLALDIVGRHDRPSRPLGRDEQRRLVGELLAATPDRWPTLAPAAGGGELLGEVADAVCHYQASWLGVEELRTHADAAGEAERWEELAALTRAYRAALDAEGAVDWAGALVQAGLVLRDPAVGEAERARFDHVIVDDFEHTSFAAHRLLASLVGPGGNVVVAGNPDAPVPTARTAGDRRWMERFARSYGARLDVALDRRLVPAPEVSVVRWLREVGDGEVAGDELLHLRRDGVPWSSMAVIVCEWERDARDVFEKLERRDVPTVAGEGPDPWDPGPPEADAVTVTTVEGSAGRTWPSVVVTSGPGQGPEPTPPPQPAVLDIALLAGPDVPAPEERAAAWEAEERRRHELIGSRATEGLILLSGPGRRRI